MRSLDGLSRIGRRDYRVDDVNAFYDQHLVFDLDFAGDFGGQSLMACIDLSRFQRTA